MQEAVTVTTQNNLYSIGAFIGYLILVSGIGIYAARFSSKGVKEFFVGGRQMNRFVVALSAVVSGRSSWLLLGVTGMAYKMGASAVWAVLGYILVELFLFLFYARRLRRISEYYDCVTLPDFFAARFGDKNGLLRGTLAVIILLFMISYVSAQFVGGGKAFAAGFSIDPLAGILITAAIVLFYTILGGFLAVSLTDMIQAFFMIFALVLLPVIAFWDQGGFTAVVEQLRQIDKNMIDPFALSIGAAIGFLGIGLGSPGNPHIIARYMSIDDPEQLRYSAVVGTIWNVIMAWVLCLSVWPGGYIFLKLPSYLQAILKNYTRCLPRNICILFYLALWSPLFSQPSCPPPIHSSLWQPPALCAISMKR